MKPARWKRSEELLSTGELPAVLRFGSGQVANILGVPIWRLQKFLQSRRYKLSPSGQLGKGFGSRRLFSREDVYRIGIASFLVKDGFAPKLVAQILQQIEDRDLIDFNEHGEVHTGIKLIRTGKGPSLDFFRSGHPPDIRPGGNVYYALDLAEITSDIDRRISSMMAEKGNR